MVKIYHIYFLLLIFILLLTSCAVTPSVDREDPMSTEVTIQQSTIIQNQALQQLGETHPQANLLYEQARAAEARGELDLAIETYHKAMQKAPENSLLLTDLGMAYLRNEDIVPARRYLLKAVSSDPDYYKSRLGLGYIYLQKQQLPKAIVQLESSIELLPTLEGTFLLGEAEEAQGNQPRARQHYQAVVRADKDSKLGKVAATRLRSLPK